MNYPQDSSLENSSEVQFKHRPNKWESISRLIDHIQTKIQRFHTNNLNLFCFFSKKDILEFEELESKLKKIQQKIKESQKSEAYLLDLNAKLQRLATTDGLTKVANRYWFDRCLDQYWGKSIRNLRPLSVIMCDVDFFKLYNDYYGHQAGDRCLRKVAQVIRKSVKRSADLVARYGGEEFAVILPETTQAEAIQVAESIRSELQQLKIPHAQSHTSQYVTVSMGLSSMIPTQDSSPEQLVAEVDGRLYQAKKAGRNCLKCRDEKQKQSEKIHITLREDEPDRSTSIMHWSFEKESMIRIGRAHDNDIVLTNRVVSRHHLKLRRFGDRWQLTSFGQNGTYINSREIDRVMLQGGEIVNLTLVGPTIEINFK